MIVENASQLEAAGNDLTLAEIPQIHAVPVRSWRVLWRQMIRFGIVGGLNTAIDILVLNVLIITLPTQNPFFLIMYNAFAYTVGAVNSYVLNRYWTFKSGNPYINGEVMRFIVVTVFGLFCNSLLVGLISGLTHSLIGNTLIWVNTAKILAIFATAILSYVGMCFWVFVDKSQNRKQKEEGPTL